MKLEINTFFPPTEAVEQLLEIRVIFGKVKLKRLNPWVVKQVCARRMLNKLWLLLWENKKCSFTETKAYERIRAVEPSIVTMAVSVL